VSAGGVSERTEPTESPILVYSEVESDRFGLRVFRQSSLRAGAFSKSELEDASVDVVIIRIPTETDRWQTVLDATGYPYIVADVLVHYDADLNGHSPILHNPELRLVPISKGDDEACHRLDSLVAEVFVDYPTHYLRNPLFPPDDVLAGYVEWAAGHIGGETTDAFLAVLDDDAVGLAVCRYEADAIVGVLHGVRPEFSARGIHTDIIRLIQAVGRSRGLRTMHTSTQIENVAAQRSWISAGLRPLRSEYTVHLNAMLSAGGEVRP
jgi:hypothetical protein